MSVLLLQVAAMPRLERVVGCNRVSTTHPHEEMHDQTFATAAIKATAACTAAFLKGSLLLGTTTRPLIDSHPHNALAPNHLAKTVGAFLLRMFIADVTSFRLFWFRFQNPRKTHCDKTARRGRNANRYNLKNKRNETLFM